MCAIMNCYHIRDQFYKAVVSAYVTVTNVLSVYYRGNWADCSSDVGTENSGFVRLTLVESKALVVRCPVLH